MLGQELVGAWKGFSSRDTEYLVEQKPRNRGKAGPCWHSCWSHAGTRLVPTVMSLRKYDWD